LNIIFLQCFAFSTKKRFRKTLWELILVGDLIHVSSDEKLPADIVLIRSSDPEGCVFVETANLDGENNLKQKVVVGKCKQYCLVSFVLQIS
jgi:phospholipid-translocating ATPase